jgi:hypothetical protein
VVGFTHSGDEASLETKQTVNKENGVKQKLSKTQSKSTTKFQHTMQKLLPFKPESEASQRNTLTPPPTSGKCSQYLLELQEYVLDGHLE